MNDNITNSEFLDIKSTLEKDSSNIELSYVQDEHFISIYTQDTFQDGDNIVSILKKENNQYIITDMAHTYMYFSYTIDISNLENEPIGRELESIIKKFGIIENNNGELYMIVKDNSFKASIDNFISCMLRLETVIFKQQNSLASVNIS